MSTSQPEPPVTLAKPEQLTPYDKTKALAKELGVRVGGVLALAEDNDPFYCGRPAHVADGEWFADLWRRCGFAMGLHLRRIHEVQTLREAGGLHAFALTDARALGTPEDFEKG